MAVHDDHNARIARLDAMIERAKTLPSLPEIALWLEQLTRDIAKLTARVAELEQECEALRQRELIRLWETDAKED